jgi:hypothetical protein
MTRSRLLMTILLAFPAVAAAYTDPGSGALLWQMIVAAFIGVMFYLRRMILWFGSRRKN